MAKEVTFIVDAPPCGSLLEAWADFLVKHAARKADIEVSGTVRPRAPGETGYPVKPAAAKPEAAS